MTQPDGFVGLPLTAQQVEIYLCLAHEGMDAREVLAAQHRAIEITRAHDEVGKLHGFSR